MKWLLLLVLFSYIDDQKAMSWPGFLGPVSSEVQGDRLPLNWAPQTNVAWQVNLSGYGQSSSVVWGDHVYVTMVEGAKKETLRLQAYQIADGKRLWQQDIATKNLGENTDYFSRAAPTPVVDATGIYVLYESGDFAAYQHDGKLIWQRDLVAEFGVIKSRHGLSSSPIQDEQHVFICIQSDENPYLMAVSKLDGKTVWKVERPAGTSWSSPMWFEATDGSRHIVISAAGSGGRAPGETLPGSLIAYEPAGGKEQWKLSGLSGNSAPTPRMVSPGRLLVGASAGREGGPTKEAIETNGLVEVKKGDSGYEANYVWRSKRATCGFCSPAAYQGIAYYVDRRGTLFGLDLETGSELFTERLGFPVWATPVGVGDRVYLVGEDGMTKVIAAGQKYQVLATNSLWEPSAVAEAESENPRAMLNKIRQYAIAVAGESILIRRGDKLYCVRSK
jgi:outer membrane protein assembly factor BamB